MGGSASGSSSNYQIELLGELVIIILLTVLRSGFSRG
jgi:hypothetical protein